MCLNKGDGVVGVGGGGGGGGHGVYASPRCHYVVASVLGWGMGSTWLRLHPAGCATAFGLGWGGWVGGGGVAL